MELVMCLAQRNVSKNQRESQGKDGVASTKHTLDYKLMANCTDRKEDSSLNAEGPQGLGAAMWMQSQAGKSKPSYIQASHTTYRSTWFLLLVLCSRG